ncbi:MAG: DNA polymerase III subunit delta [Oscillospiraceae bacterium]|nr:DNA polymerase III subunit delta [Oscillospiraceae bacterium]
MAKKRDESPGYDRLKAVKDAEELKILYIFHGEERYLLERYTERVRDLLIPEGARDFNHRKYDGKKLSVVELAEAVDAMPFLAEHTLVEVWDMDLFKLPEEEKNYLLDVLSDLPDYICLLFVYDTLEFKIDGRVKINGALKKLFEIVEFKRQGQSEIVKWIKRRFKALNKEISSEDAEYLAFLTGGLMATLVTETEKLAAYSGGNVITRNSIDAVVIPVLEAEIYKLTDSITQFDFEGAAVLLSKLIAMREAPQRLVFSIAGKMRQLFSARICVDSGIALSDYMDMCDIRYDFQARNMYQGARRVSHNWCRRAVELSGDTALRLNSGGGEAYELLSQLLAELALVER